jgi:hypothetical protein
MTNHLRTGDILDDSPRAVVLATVGFDAQSEICACCGAALERLLRDVDPALLEAVRPRPLDAGSPGVADLVAQDQSFEQDRKRVEALGGQWRCVQQLRFDGENAPQAVLILPAARLLDDGDRAQLVESLAEAAPRVACLSLVFIEDRQRLLRPGTTAADLRRWIEPFGKLADPAWVSIHLVCLGLESGDLLHPEELSETVAGALCADLVLGSPQTERVLTSRPPRPGVSLSTFGLRTMRFDRQRVAERFAPRLVSELLGRVVLGEPSGSLVEAASLVPSATDVLVEAFPSNAEFNARLLVESSRPGGGFPADCPALAGPESMATLDLGAMAKGGQIGRLPLRRWAEYVHQWDFFVRQSRLPRLLTRVANSLASIADRQAHEIPDALSREFSATSDGAATAVELCDAAADRVQHQYTLDVRRGGSRALKENLRDLIRALADIPHLYSLAARAAVLSAVQLLLIVGVWKTDPSPLRTALLVGLGVLVLLTPLVSLSPWWRAAARARAVRDQALKDTETRAQLAFCLELQGQFEGICGERMAEADRYREVLVASGKALEGLKAGAHAAAPPGEPRFVFPMPEPWREEDLYQCVVGAELGAPNNGGDLVSRFSSAVKAAVREALDGKIPPAVVAERAGQFAVDELANRLRTRFQLWMLLRRDMSEGPPDTEIVERAVEPLGAELPLVFLQGTLVREALFGSDRLKKHFVAPPLLCQFQPQAINAEPVESGMDNCVVVMSRVELASVECGEDDPRSAGNAPGPA